MTAHDETSTSETTAALEELNGIRQSIDNIDAALVHLLAERFKFTQQVGRLKAVHGLPAADPDRERRQIQRLRTLAEGAHLDPAFAEKWFNFVVAEVIHHHVKIAEGGENQAEPTPAREQQAAAPSASPAVAPSSAPMPGDRRVPHAPAQAPAPTAPAAAAQAPKAPSTGHARPKPSPAPPAQ